MWLTVAGNVGKAGGAKTMMTNAVIGAILLFAAYMILFTINPDLVRNTFNFSLPQSETSTSTPREEVTDSTVGSASITGLVENESVGFQVVPTANAQAGIYFFTVRVVDASGDTFDQGYSMEVLNNALEAGRPKQKLAHSRQINSRPVARAAVDSVPLTITTPFVSDAIIGQPYFAEIVAVGGQPPYAYSLVGDIGSNFFGNVARAAGGLPKGLRLQTTFEMPILRVENLTAARNPTFLFHSGDRFRLTLSGAEPSSTLFFKRQKNGAPWFFPGKTPDVNGWIDFGRTDASGRWVNEADFSVNEIGSWHEWAMVAGKTSNIISFEVVRPGTSPAVAGNCNTQPPIGTCPTGTRWTCHMDTTKNPPPPLCSQNGSLTGAVAGNPGGVPAGGAGAGSVPPDGGALGEGCQGFGVGPGEANFLDQFRTCNEEIRRRMDENNNVNTAGLPACGSQNTTCGGPCLHIGATIDGRETRTIRCTYSNQAQATCCGAPGSGEFCLPGFNQPGCVPQATCGSTLATANSSPSCAGAAGGGAGGAGGGGGGAPTCVANAGQSCDSGDCRTSQTIQCNGSCGGGTVSGTHGECSGTSCNQVPNTINSCANQCSGRIINNPDCGA